MRKQALTYILLSLLLLLSADLTAQRVLEQRISDSLTVIANDYFFTARINRIKIDVNRQRKSVVVTASENLGFFPFREENVNRIYNAMNVILASTYPDHTLRVEAYNRDIRDLIPVYYRQKPDPTRLFSTGFNEPPVLKNLSKHYDPFNGLLNRHIALWNSHGVYFNQSRSRWEWQRPLLFQTVEDLLTTAFVIPYLVPMLENAGANVFLPRERDIQMNEVVVDNDCEGKPSKYKEYVGRQHWTSFENGFANPKEHYLLGENPFRMGTARAAYTVTNPNHASRIQWTPFIPEQGKYAVYVSYQSVGNSTSDARYTVYHAGGQTEFSVNQTMFGGSWLYLGHFDFEEGTNNNGKVVLSNVSKDADKVITADAVKFGGGVGNMARVRTNNNNNNNRNGEPPTPSVSNFPRFMEGARYWLQWAGAPDSVYSRTANTNDYSDDFQSRGFWVNYLSGGSASNPGVGGLNVPLDLAFAFHTDAGIKPDTIIGTLAISTVLNSNGETVFRNGKSRWASRDLADIIQTQIVNDIRKEFHSEWTRRGLWNRSYSESRNPEVPTMLLELLSHQNFEDMKYALDPRFRFTVSRSIYKAILKHLAFVNGYNYVVQPLPVENFRINFSGRHKIRLQWNEVPDPLEPSARAEKYVVYTRIDDGAFDNGRLVDSNSFDTTIVPGKIYSFKITAINSGGESFPSEILAAYRDWRNRGEILIVNGFERISGPDKITSGPDPGFYSKTDNGVPYLYDLSHIGAQYDFNPNSKYVSNERPGFGASRTDQQDKVIAGNSFDYPFIHGIAIKNAGYSFVSASVKSVIDAEVDLNKFQAVNLILGKQKKSFNGKNGSLPNFETFPKNLQHKIRQYSEQGGRMLVSGAYVASDLTSSGGGNSFLTDVLKIQLSNSDASATGELLYKSDNNRHFIGNDIFTYQHVPDQRYYVVENPDLIQPSDNDAFVFMRMHGADENAAVGIAWAGNYRTCTLSIPFETINDEESRNKLMSSILYFLFRRR